jgi:hypothetical protein
MRNGVPLYRFNVRKSHNVTTWSKPATRPTLDVATPFEFDTNNYFLCVAIYTLELKSDILPEEC